METERLLLRVLTEEDSKFLFRLMNTDKWYRYIGDRKITDDKKAKEYIRSKMSADLKDKGFINHVMTDRSSNQMVGTCSLHDREGIDGMDIGYALLPEFEGKGYATEGASHMAKIAFEDYQQSKIHAITSVKNDASGRVLGRLGFTLHSLITLPGGDEELNFYILKKEKFKRYK